MLPRTAPMFRDALSQLAEQGLVSAESRILFVNDGSGDGTWGIIKDLAGKDPVFKGISLSRNRGHQNALLCGLMECRGNCDVSVSLDCDGQDDVSKVSEMLLRYGEGCDVV